MPIWHERADDKTQMTGEVVGDLLEAWAGSFDTKEAAHKAEDVAGIIDLMYEVQPVPGAWARVKVSTSQLLEHLQLPMESSDWGKAAMYGARLQAESEKPPPIILVGAEEDGRRGLALLDGRRRIHAASIAGKDRIEAWVPEEHLGVMGETPPRAAIIGAGIGGAGIVR